MRLSTPATTAALLLALSAAAAADKPRINGWYPCAFSSKTNTDKYGTSYANMTVFECAEVEVPLCYDGVCTSDDAIDVFVKRRRAKKTANATKAVLLLEGGPGYATTGMEYRIERLTKLLGDSVDYYLIDHRGTGRSEFLQCDAAQALTAGSPKGKALSVDELQACLADLNFKYDGQAAAFGTTSVAMDVRTMVELFMAKQEVFVTGYSYGTYVTQRIMQLDIPQVKGYVFDGVDALSVKGDSVETANSHWNQAMVAPSRRLLEFCYDDPKCPIKFKSRDTVLQETLEFMDKLDEEAAINPCAMILVHGLNYSEPSVGLRGWMNKRVLDVSSRATALAMLGRVMRCNSQHIQTMKEVFLTKKDVPPLPTPAVLDELTEESPLLYNVVVYSERWAQPAPTLRQRNDFYLDSVFSMEDSEAALQYCVFTGSTEPACQELEKILPTTRKQTFFYKRDKYVSKPMTLPAHASALILNGGLDFQTPREFGELLYNKLKGSGTGVMIVNFDYGVHCRGEAVAEAPDRPCYDAIIAGFIQHSGDVAKIDTTCMANLPDTAFHEL